MVNLVLGRSFSGKSREIINRISDCIKMGEEPIVFFPEQFSFEGEKSVLEALGEEMFSKVTVLSFSKLYEVISQIKGGICGKVISNTHKIILTSRAVESVSNDLILWKKYADSAVFAENILTSIDEFKTNAVSTQDLKEIQAKGKLNDKIHDISLIFDAYTMLLGTNFIDPSDNFDRLYDMLGNCDYFENKTVFFDGFKNFTGQQFKILSQILAKSKNVTFAFLDDKNDNRKYSVLKNIRETKRKIIDLSRKYNQNIEQTYLETNYYSNKSMKNLESVVFGDKITTNCNNPNVVIFNAETIYDEADFVARTIRKKVREENLRYKDFLVVARNSEDYQDALSVACERNKVKCFIDKKYPLSSTPISLTVLSAIEYAVNSDIKNIFKFHKSGINILSIKEVSSLENYTFVWDLKGKDFKTQWNMNPMGLTENQGKDYEEILKEINEIREKAITPLEKFKSDFKGSPKNRCTAIINLLLRNNAKNAYTELLKQYETQEKYDFCHVLNQSYDAFMSVLDSIVSCFPDGEISNDKFISALKVALKSQTIGVTPQTLDEVVFSEADRLRQERPKFVFLMGANQGVFPRAVKSSGIFTNTEISALKDAGLPITDRTVDFAIDEELLVYSNLCCASTGAVISYSSFCADGTASQESPFVSHIVNELNLDILTEPCELNENCIPESEADCFSEYCRRFSDIKSRITFEKALDNTKFESVVNDLKQCKDAGQASISRQTAKKLYGKNIYMSPTKFDTYNRCKFSYFCRYALNAQRIYKADFNVMQRGTLVHYVLQHIIEKYGKKVSEMDTETISIEVDFFIDEYLDSIPGYRAVENSHLKYIVSTMSRSLKYVVEKISLEFRQSKFEPVRCELKIGENCEIPEIKIDLAEGCLKLSGTVDRVDTYNGYIRIIDYKTGSKSFKLPDILFGQNMQMLLYLYALMTDGTFGEKPAGILYMNAKREKEATVKSRKMDGLIVADKELVSSMDKDNKGEFIPKFDEDKPSNSYLSNEDFSKVFTYIGNKLNKIGNDIYDGKIDAKPVNGLESEACKYCDFSSVCRISKESVKKVPKISNSEVIKTIEDGGETDGI